MKSIPNNTEVSKDLDKLLQLTKNVSMSSKRDTLDCLSPINLSNISHDIALDWKNIAARAGVVTQEVLKNIPTLHTPLDCAQKLTEILRDRSFPISKFKDILIESGKETVVVKGFLESLDFISPNINNNNNTESQNVWARIIQHFRRHLTILEKNLPLIAPNATHYQYYMGIIMEISSLTQLHYQQVYKKTKKKTKNKKKQKQKNKKTKKQKNKKTKKQKNKKTKKQKNKKTKKQKNKKKKNKKTKKQKKQKNKKTKKQKNKTKNS